MNRILRIALAAVGFLAASAGLLEAQSAPLAGPLQLSDSTNYNLSSFQGLPISHTAGTPKGSDGLAPATVQYNTLNPTPNPLQWQGFASFGGVGPTYTTGPFKGVNPGNGGTVGIIASHIRVGGSFFIQQISIKFGQVIPPPANSENNALVGSGYWLQEPYSVSAHANDPFYWSPNARQTYASQAGPIQITWMKATPYTTANFPSTYVNLLGSANSVNIAGNVYLLYTVNYVISSSAVKTPQLMYWTEGAFAASGKTVPLPSSGVALKIVYNSVFPSNVVTEYVNPYQANAATLTNLDTLYVSAADNNLHAYNTQGRIFLEVLGDLNPDGVTHQQLGTEIVDVFQQPTPNDVSIYLGERLTPPQTASIATNVPSLIIQGDAVSLVFQQSFTSTDVRYYALEPTVNENDLLMFWLNLGAGGLQWPNVLGRYHQGWPADITMYDQYMRPKVANAAAAAATAVALPAAESPAIVYQDPDPLPDTNGVVTAERAQITGNSMFFTYLDPTFPAQRCLLQFNSGNNVAFERVFSWLDTALGSVNLSTTFNGTLVDNLSVWHPTNSTTLGTWNATNNTNFTLTLFTSAAAAPKVYNLSATVGARITAPAGEPGSSGHGAYVAGHLNLLTGNAYDTNAYQDPLAVGFALANTTSSIIPVNTTGSDKLEVWWFRPSNSAGGSLGDGAGYNSGNAALNFSAIYWPSAIGYYTIGWPTAARKIVLAALSGTPLNSPYESTGSLYYQNDSTKPGYNPNEEHALVSGGAVYALQTDLNVTNGTSFTSMPYALVDYVDADGLYSMTAFQVMREDPANGVVFDYLQSAGTPIQGPGAMGPVLENLVRAVEVIPPLGTGNTPTNWQSSDATGPYSLYQQFTYTDRNNALWVYRGLHAGEPALQAGTYTPATYSSAHVLVSPSSFSSTIGSRTGAVTHPYILYVHTSRSILDLSITNTPGSPPLPAGLSFFTNSAGIGFSGTPTAAGGPYALSLLITDTDDKTTATATLSLTVGTAAVATNTQGPMTITSYNPNTGTTSTFTGRANYLAESPAAGNSVAVQYYYPVEPGFFFPSKSLNQQPTNLTLVPFLRESGATTAADGLTDTPLSVVYRPFWPTGVPTMPFGQTLTTPTGGLPDVKDMASAVVLYQESIAIDFKTGSTAAHPPNPSVVLYDPTVAKTSALGNVGLTQLPGSVNAVLYNGFYFFPNLPPELKSVDGSGNPTSALLYYDPNTGTNGSLVLEGLDVTPVIGDSYVCLNVLNGVDLTDVLDLCAGTDPNYSKWTNAVWNLSNTMEVLIPNPAVPGTTMFDPNQAVAISVTNVSAVVSPETPVVSYALSASGPGAGYVVLLQNGGKYLGDQGNPVALTVLKTGGSLYTGDVVVDPDPNPLSEKVTFQHTADMGGRVGDYTYRWKYAEPTATGQTPATNATMSLYPGETDGIGLSHFTFAGAGVQSLEDHYITMQYSPNNPNHPMYGKWSAWTTPILEEGWIKRVVAAINPFDQRTTSLLDNAVNTEVSLLTQAGARWEGDVALNANTLTNAGLIEIYETVLDRGEALSINAGINDGAANDALLLVAGYLSDLYTDLASVAWADSENPTIGIGTGDQTFGAVATSMFSFMGEVPSLLEEQLALVRGRDDQLSPGTDLAPVYNRLYWNYTLGINAGETIYALNYNIVPAPANTSGIIGAADAAYMFPQGHGDAYGHYLTALVNYYKLLMNQNFTWRPQTEGVTVLGATVQVGYLHERKFAASASSIAQAGQQAFDLTWREEYAPVHTVGWSEYGTAAVTTNTSTGITRYWGADQWATRTGQGAYINWVVGNSLVPAIDPIASDYGTILQIDRTTIPELPQLATDNTSLQSDMDNLDGGISPLGVPADAIAFDLDPNAIVGGTNGTHFEQIYSRAIVALNNAVASFNDAQNVTQEMREEENSLTDLDAGIASQEAAYNNALIEVYGTPYTDDIGPNGSYAQGYSGPDLIHYMYVDRPESTFGGLLAPQESQTNVIAVASLGSAWLQNLYSDTSFMTNFSGISNTVAGTGGSTNYSYVLTSDGFFGKPASWSGERASVGTLQTDIAGIITAHDALGSALNQASQARNNLNNAIALFNANVAVMIQTNAIDNTAAEINNVATQIQKYADLAQKTLELGQSVEEAFDKATEDFLPESLIAGTADGGDETSAERGADEEVEAGEESGVDASEVAEMASSTAEIIADATAVSTNAQAVGSLELNAQIMNAAAALQVQASGIGSYMTAINQALQNLSNAKATYRTDTAKGLAIQADRATYRGHVAAIIQGYRTEDVAFILFRNEKLQRYLTLFNLAGMYSLLAANAYDYETGLLNTPAGRAYVNSIVNSRSLGVMLNGVPQIVGSDGGDPGLSTALAEMMADFQVLKGRLGLNNPDAYGTTVSLRSENFRILPTDAGTNAWQQILQAGRMPDLLQDADARRLCLQLDPGNGQPVPGIEITFSTTIADGLNLFGLPLAEGDHNFSPSSFATKIFAVGVAFEGYIGMDAPNGANPTGTNSVSLNPMALAATPYCYLIPVGVDSMRSPPLGDSSTIRTWSVQDVAIPLPFNIGDSDMSTLQLWTTSDALTEPLFALRMHQAFRPVPDASYFSDSLYGDSGTLLRSQYTNNRLVARSVWNSQWKLIIPGYTLLNDPNAGLDRFIATVNDIKLHFVTYSYSGN